MWLKIKVWTKVALFTLLFLYFVIFIAKNSERQVKPWFWFGREPDTSVLILVLCAFLCGVIGTILIRTTFTTLRQLRELKGRTYAERRERELKELKHLEAMRQKPPAATAGESDAATTPADPML